MLLLGLPRFFGLFASRAEQGGMKMEKAGGTLPVETPHTQVSDLDTKINQLLELEAKKKNIFKT